MLTNEENNKVLKSVNSFRNILTKNKRLLIVLVLLIIASIVSYYFISTNEAYYKKTIAKITSATETKDSPVYDIKGNQEQVFRQDIKAVIMNGKYKGTKIKLQNKTSYSKAVDIRYKVNDEVFVLIKYDDTAQKIVSAKIIDFKRDKYIAYIAILFIFLILLIGGIKGLKSLTSVVANIIIFSTAIGLFLKGFSLLVISITASLLFIIISISLVSGINKKTISAVIGTMVGTIFSMLITLAVILLTKANGMHYEEMEFLTCTPEQIFLAEVLIGTLGGIMDIAVSISSAIQELFDKKPDTDRKDLVKSGMEIGKDIMGTMANTLVFAYISGSIPMILLWLRNGFSPMYIINFNISLEIVRALTGSIGIVISIPITIYISVILLRRNKMGEA